MSQSTNRKEVIEQPMYIVWILLLLGLVSLLQYTIPIGIYRIIYGVPQMTDWMSVPVYEYEHAVLWKGRVWYQVMRVGPNSGFGTAILTSFDPEKGDIVESQWTVPFPAIGFVADEDRLWAVASGSVIRIEGEEQDEFKPRRTLGRPSEPFLYEGKVAVIEMTSKPNPELLVFEKGEWNSLGDVAIPFGFVGVTVEGKPVLIPVSVQSNVGAAMMDAKVLQVDGQYHLFVSEGAVVAYRPGIEMAPASAMAPNNVQSVVDFSNLKEWEAVCGTSSMVRRGGETGWKVGLLNGEPIVIATDSQITSPFQKSSLKAFQRQHGEWQQVADQSAPAMLSLFAASDGKKLYTAVQSFTQTLRIYRLADAGFQRTGVFLKAPVAPFQEPLQRWAQIYQWVYWPGLLILAMGISRLMSAYLESQYQFGNTTVELASFTRRGFARLIDMLVFWLPNYILTVAFGMASQEQIAENMDKLFDSGPEGLLTRLIWLILGLVISGLLFLVINSCLQGWWGLTLGKWICGIRTLRTTLRPCGFARALLREILIIADTLFAMSIIPVTLAIAFSRYRQRLGDMAADTLVIRNPAIKPVKVPEIAVVP